MKKIILLASAFAGFFLAASCQRENLEPVAGNNVVSYTIQVPDALSTKAIGEDVSAVNQLVYEVYHTEATSATDFSKAETPLFQKTAEPVEGAPGTFKIDFELVNNQNFRVLFWAQVKDNGVYTIPAKENGGLKNVTISQALSANNEGYAAFANSDFIKSGDKLAGRTITLVRPISQLNIATTPESLSLEGQTTVKIASTAVTVNGLSTSYNVAEGVAGDVATADFEYSETNPAGLSEPSISVNGKPYTYVAMNYVGFAANPSSTVVVSYTINTENVGTITNTIENVPVKANYRTNIIGNLITSTSDYTIELEADWAENDITHAFDASAAQAALDSAVPGSTIQLHPGVNYGTLYLRPSANTDVTKTVDWQGNNYGWETYSLFKDVTIKGAEGATVDAIEIEGNTYYKTPHSQSEAYPVMLSLIELNNVVIDGVTFTGKGGYDPQGYGNAINLSGGNIKVDGLTLRNCVLNNADNNARLIYKTESTTAVHTYTFGGETFTFSPTLKDITVTGTTFNGGYMGLELRETENVTITNNTFNVDDRNILLPVNTGCTYSGKVIITGNVSNNAKERFVRMDGAGDAEVIITDNILNNYHGDDADYIKVTGATNLTVENNTCGVSSAEELVALVNNATSDIVIALGNDIEGKITLIQKHGINVTILGNGKTFKGSIHIFGNGASDDRSMTIKNINFDGTGLGDKEGCIYTTGAVDGKNSYACNVTIEACTFTGAGVAAIRQNVAGERDWTIKNCTVAENMHSLLQVSNTNGELVVENCKVYSKNGANLNSTCVATFTGCEFDVRGYAVRVGVNSGGNPDATKLYTFTNCSFESENEDGDAVVIIRKDAQKATLNFVDTELIGDPKISGNTSATKISGIDLPQQNWEIWYTATALVHAHWYKDKFGEGTDLVSNVWDETTGKGVITLSGPVTKIGANTFYDRVELTSISFPNSVTTVGDNNNSVFSGCTNLTTVEFGNSVQFIGYQAFTGCKNLTNVVFPESLTTIAESAFNSCTALKAITLPAGVTTIGDFAFNGITELKVYCKATIPPTVGSIPFNKWWAEIYVPAASLTAYQDAWGSVVDNIYAE